jgi:hypothetical protein
MSTTAPKSNDDSTETGSQNQISTWGKVAAGILLALFTLIAMNTIISYWPDKLPPPGDSGRYYHKCHNTMLLSGAAIKQPGSEKDTAAAAAFKNKQDSVIKKIKAGQAKVAKTDSGTIAALKADQTKHAKAVGDSTLKAKKALAKVDSVKSVKYNDTAQKTALYDIDDTIQFNTILLILVAAAGFLGNMIHVAGSFTAFVGLEKFKKSWLLWYFVKPFTASALAVVVYFTFRAGFLSTNDGGNNLNLFGIMAISAMAGLFTEVVTRRLRDVLDVVFKAKSENQSSVPAKADVLAVSGIAPDKFKANTTGVITITGTDFDKKKLTITLDKKPVDDKEVTITATSIKINYPVPAVGVTKVVLLITPEGMKPYTHTFPVE